MTSDGDFFRACNAVGIRAEDIPKLKTHCNAIKKRVETVGVAASKLERRRRCKALDRQLTLPLRPVRRPPQYGLLCDELLLTVLGFVDEATLRRAGATCRQWRLQYEEPSLWRLIPLDLSGIRSLQTWRRVRASSERSPHWRHAVSLKVPRMACATVMHASLTLLGSRLMELDLRGLSGDAALCYFVLLVASPWRPQMKLDRFGRRSDLRKFCAEWVLKECCTIQD